MADDQENGGARLLASTRHTTRLCLILLFIAAVGFAAQHFGHGPTAIGSRPQRLFIYLPLLAAELGLFAYVRLGLTKGGTSIVRLVTGGRMSFASFVSDIAAGVVLFAVLLAVEAVWSLALGPGDRSAVTALRVRDPADVPLWIALSVCAGFVEELAFRGYLQQQFAAIVRSPLLGLLLQAALFAVTHGYQGADALSRIAVFGVLFGATALWRGSLIPGMIAHASVDVLGGLAH